jgi:hypothetical protein
MVLLSNVRLRIHCGGVWRIRRGMDIELNLQNREKRRKMTGKMAVFIMVTNYILFYILSKMTRACSELWPATVDFARMTYARCVPL